MTYRVTTATSALYALSPQPTAAATLTWESAPSQHLSDHDRTIQAARRGDERAFSSLIDLYRAAAERVAQQILHTEEAAADAVQEAMLKAHRAMARFHEGNFRSWFLRIVTNTCYDHLRQQRRHATVSLDELTERAGLDYLPAEEAIAHCIDEDPEALVLQNESMRLLLSAIEGLPSYHRDVVMLVDVQGYDYAEAAELLGLPLGTVKSRLSRARAALRDQLVKSGIVAAPM
ncbi:MULTISPECIES: RNA polymerase sigma factor [Caldilinea]|uniref:Putative RNA polymerase ECF-type sigma factor n=1 Tax=Caldilinea aerophila (strain DSM 14535 / JCM 11387 / NBRC 104270 / STL-6-O1) TaxID=926550 RepID=I0I558_CALAS|nr:MULTISPECIES: RNA polymerase sigma factor [Caldilinea]BAM00396.1 putative RNA polymerase ECF-type sigma factor [Caldilinea aerophila DSM 14535 = NBRC 104270]GIV71750.1 MAG: RNA polymerase subunit sigma-24 [Caldilinea sp.]